MINLLWQKKIMIIVVFFFFQEQHNQILSGISNLSDYKTLSGDFLPSPLQVCEETAYSYSLDL